ncbi:hypothetical protein [Robbsia andropogonis]|uniref:hypothetical protein n=1 Tax=Robbsia andropogonis TaxID=28092 RepID=UPI0004639F8D|nr:hypothetical protein [Robbsia andropogonis]
MFNRFRLGSPGSSKSATGGIETAGEPDRTTGKTPSTHSRRLPGEIRSQLPQRSEAGVGRASPVSVAPRQAAPLLPAQRQTFPPEYHGDTIDSLQSQYGTDSVPLSASSGAAMPSSAQAKQEAPVHETSLFELTPEQSGGWGVTFLKNKGHLREGVTQSAAEVHEDEPAVMPDNGGATSEILPDDTGGPIRSWSASQESGRRSTSAHRSGGMLPPATADAASARRGTVKSRLAQLIDIRRVPQAPAVRVDDWSDRSALEICEGWRESLVETVSIPSMSRLVALNFERVHAAAIPADLRDQCLLPEGAGGQAYYDEMVRTFLNAVGCKDPDDIDKVLDSFKQTGTGGLHRQRVMTASLLNSGISIAQLAASSHVAAKTAMSTAQMLLTVASSRLAFTSAKLRFRNAGTEEIMPLGKADATPSAKSGASVAGASLAVMRHLGKIEKDVKRMNIALAALERAGTPDEKRVAADALSIAFARFCVRSEMKLDYKTASESAKIEFFGNELNLYANYVSGTAGLVTTIMSIVTPALISAHATLGASAATLGLTALLYVGYQLSSGPSRDGEAKAKRAIVALSKSLDLLGGNARKQQMRRAQAYRGYVDERAKTKEPGARAEAKTKLLDELRQIAREDSTQDDLNPLQNWTDYTHFQQRVALIKAVVASPEALQVAEGNEHAVKAAVAEAVSELELAFTATHQHKFKTSTIVDAWKTPYRIRFDSMGRLLLGKVSQSSRTVLDLDAKRVKVQASRERQAGSSVRSHPGTLAQDARLKGQRQDLKATLTNWINFEFAQSRLHAFAALSADDAVRLPTTLREATQALAAVNDPDAQALFVGDGRAQVEATRLAKKLTAGEEERYTVTGGGSAILSTVANTAGGAYGLGVNIAKTAATSHGAHLTTHYGDQRDGQLLTQGSAPFTAHYSSGERARFQKNDMARLLATLKRSGDPVKLKLELGPAQEGKFALDDPQFDSALDKLIQQMETQRDMPDEIDVSIDGAKAFTGKLNGTTDYHKWRYDHATLRKKLDFHRTQANVLAKGIGVSVFSPVLQGMAQISLKNTRRAAYRGDEMSPDVRDKLRELATPPADEDRAMDDST